MLPTHDSTLQSTVLLVDDEEYLRRLLSRILSEAGFGVVEAENGAVKRFSPRCPNWSPTE